MAHRCPPRLSLARKSNPTCLPSLALRLSPFLLSCSSATQDHVDILANMKCGAQARFQFSSVTGLAEQAKGFWLFGTKGTIHLDIATKTLRFGIAGGSLEPVTIADADAAGWRVEDEFIGAIRGTEQVKLTDFVTGVKYMAFTDAVSKSLITKSVVAISSL